MACGSTPDVVRKFVQGNDRWPQSTNPSARLRAARAMPQWISARGSAVPPPPPPPPQLEDLGPIEPEYEVIEFPGQQTYSNQPVIRSTEKEKKRCDLCGSSAPAVKCMQCVQQHFCYSCDDMYHRHPKRQSHIRKEIDGGGKRPPLPPKGEPSSAPPIPPPRRNKRATPRPTLTPPHPPLSPHSPQRGSVSPKPPGLVGSLKRIMGMRQMPGVTHTLDRQNSLPPSASMMGFHDQQMMNCNGFPDWQDPHRGHRAGSFSALNSPGQFGHMMQAQSMAHLNCPGCHGHGMWNPWGGMPPSGAWQSSAVLNSRGGPPAREDWSDSDSDQGWHRERLRRFSTVSARGQKGYGFEDVPRGGRKTDVETSSHKGYRRKDSDTMSNRGGRKQDWDTMSNRGGRKQDWETMSNRGGRKQDFDTMSLRGVRRNDFDNSPLKSQRKRGEDKLSKKLVDNRYKDERDDSETSDERESEEEIVETRGGRTAMSDLEDIHRNRRRSQPPSPVQQPQKPDTTQKKKNKRNERFIDTGRRRSSPVGYKYGSPSGDEDTKEFPIANGSGPNEKLENGIENIEDKPEEDLGPVPEAEWECMHCTFVNEGGTRVCAVCCRTTSKPSVRRAEENPPAGEEENKPNRLENVTKHPKAEPADLVEKTEKIKEKRGVQSPEGKSRTLTSTGTSPPPQSISTQTYEEAGRKLKKATSLADYGEWKAPRRSSSRQSLLSDTQSLPVTPPRSRSPEHLRQELTTRRPSDLISQRSMRRAGSQPPEYLSTLVQKQVKQGLEMVKLLREAEGHQFSADDLAVALVHCGDGDPVAWLQDNWRNMIDTVVTLGTNYGQERKENIVGTISASEAREALRAHEGNVWAAVTDCVEQRQKKYAELLSRGNFSREDIVTVLTAHRGNVEEAYRELNKNQLKPFLMRIWGPPQGAENDDGDITKLAHGDSVGRGGKNSEEVSVDLSIDSNYERIQTWLEDQVHNSNKLSISQSMLQLNLGGLNQSSEQADWRRSNTLLNSRPKQKYRRNSDVHRYLTHLYNANDKSLLIHSVSTNNLSKTENSIQNSYNLYKNTGNDVETVTIKLNPVIVKSEEAKLDLTNDNDRKESSGSDESGSSEEDESESRSEEIKLDPNKDENKYLKVESKSLPGSSSVSVGPSDKSETKEGYSSSDSETSSESFESVHSSIDGNLTNTKERTRLNTYSLSDGSSSSGSITNAYENITVMRIQEMEHKQADETQENAEGQDGIGNSVDMGKYIQADVSDQSEISELIINSKSEYDIEYVNVNPLQVIGESIITENIDSFSTNESDEKFQEVLTDEDIPFIEETVNNQKEKDEVQITKVEIGVMDGSERSSIQSNEASERDKSKTDDDLNDRSVSNKNTLKVPDKRKLFSRRKNEHLEMWKSESETNRDGEVHLDYNDERQLFDISGIRDLSEGNSDKDVSSIKTDSELEENEVNTIRRKERDDPFRNSQNELIELLKKSLTNDDVVQKLVTTLFASVLQASVAKEQVKSNEEVTEEIQNEPLDGTKEVNEVFEQTDEVGLTSHETPDPERQTTSKDITTPIESSIEVAVEADVTSSNSSDPITDEPIVYGQMTIVMKEGVSDRKGAPPLVNESVSSESVIVEGPGPEVDQVPRVEEGQQGLAADQDKPDQVNEFQREVRRLLAEGFVSTYEQAEIAVQLRELNFEDDMIVTAVKECSSLDAAVAYLQQECQLCAGKYSAKQMVSMLECEHRCCVECAGNYFSLQITERNITDCVCPFCKEPDILHAEEDNVLNYFSHLDIFLKGIVKENIHELFQRKLRDRTLMQDPNFKWCVKCSSGFIANPRQKRLVCPDCKAVTCAKCMKPWEKKHETMSCEEYVEWLKENDPEHQLTKHLDENGVTCPNCKSKYLLARGGCMHLTCPQCKHEFCSGCTKPFLMGSKCNVSEYCQKLGLHSHHPRNCLFYLRDKEPEELERLLEENKIDYKRSDESDLTKRCGIQMLKETAEGLVEGICGYTTIKAGLCRTHYIESLVVRIRLSKVDPVRLLDFGEALQELKRNGITAPERPAGMSEFNYRQMCFKVIEEEIPLE